MLLSNKLEMCSQGNISCVLNHTDEIALVVDGGIVGSGSTEVQVLVQRVVADAAVDLNSISFKMVEVLNSGESGPEVESLGCIAQDKQVSANQRCLGNLE